MISKRRIISIFVITAAVMMILSALTSLIVRNAVPPTMAAQRQAYQNRPAPGGIIHRDIPYRRSIFGTQRLDIYMPDSTYESEIPNNPVPAVVFVHGGSWVHGSKEDIRVVDRFLSKIRAEGWALISIDYVSNPLLLLDAPAGNVRVALNWIQDNIESYGINPQDMGLYSVSAGSHLVLEALAETDTPSENWRFWLEECGPTDLLAMANGEAFDKSAALDLLPESYLRRHSPVSGITQKFPPTAIVHGNADELVAQAQSERLAERLKQTGTDVSLRIVEGGDHGFLSNSQELWITLEDEFIPFMKSHFLQTAP